MESPGYMLCSFILLLVSINRGQIHSGGCFVAFTLCRSIGFLVPQLQTCLLIHLPGLSPLTISSSASPAWRPAMSLCCFHYSLGEEKKKKKMVPISFSLGSWASTGLRLALEFNPSTHCWSPVQTLQAELSGAWKDLTLTCCQRRLLPTRLGTNHRHSDSHIQPPPLMSPTLGVSSPNGSHTSDSPPFCLWHLGKPLEPSQHLRTCCKCMCEEVTWHTLLRGF